MITEINESETLAKHISWKSKWKFDYRKCIHMKSGMMINVSLSASAKRTLCMQKNIYTSNPARCTCENRKYLGSIIDD